jgi:GNAT superfamily N-acetyltransferase
MKNPNQESVIFRKLLKNDATKVAGLHSDSDFSYDDEEIIMEYFDDCFEPGSIIIAETRGEVVGKIEIFKAYKKSRGFYAVAKRLVVKKEYRNRGIGTKLLKYAFSEAKKMGCNEVEGNVEKENVHAMRLYARLGFKPLREEVIIAKKL